MRIICLDCETGGIGKKYSLLSITFKTYDRVGSNWVFVDKMSLKVKHQVYKITPEAMAVNKIDLAMHNKDSEALTLDQIGTKQLLFKFLKKNKPAEHRLIALGHGVHGDLKIVYRNLLNQANWQTWVSSCVMDTLVLAKTYQAWGLLPSDLSLSLGSLCSYFGLSGFDFHTDEGDVDATVALFSKLENLEKT